MFFLLPLMASNKVVLVLLVLPELIICLCTENEFDKPYLIIHYYQLFVYILNSRTQCWTVHSPNLHTVWIIIQHHVFTLGSNSFSPIWTLNTIIHHIGACMATVVILIIILVSPLASLLCWPLRKVYQDIMSLGVCFGGKLVPAVFSFAHTLLIPRW